MHCFIETLDRVMGGNSTAVVLVHAINLIPRGGVGRRSAVNVLDDLNVAAKSNILAGLNVLEEVNAPDTINFKPVYPLNMARRILHLAIIAQ